MQSIRTQNLSLQRFQLRCTKRIRPLTSSLLHRCGKALNAIAFVLFMLNCETGSALFDHEPNGAAQDQLCAELSFQSRDAFRNVEATSTFGVGSQADLWTEALIAQQVVTHTPTRIVDWDRNREFAIWVDCCDVVAASSVRYIERSSRQLFVEKPGTPRVLTRRFASNPVCNFRRWRHREQARQCFEVNSLMLKGKS